MKIRYHNKRFFATGPLYLNLDKKKLKVLYPQIFKISQQIKYFFRSLGYRTIIGLIEEHIKIGDSQGAVVVQTHPLLIAAYNIDIDCIVMLKYDKEIQDLYNFEVGQKLVSINCFLQTTEYQNDLIPGINDSGMWKSVYPIIAELVSSDLEIINERIQEIGDANYNYISKLANEYLAQKPNTYRDGKPYKNTN